MLSVCGHINDRGCTNSWELMHSSCCLQVDVLNRRYEKLTADLGKAEDTGAFANQISDVLN